MRAVDVRHNERLVVFMRTLGSPVTPPDDRATADYQIARALWGSIRPDHQDDFLDKITAALATARREEREACAGIAASCQTNYDAGRCCGHFIARAIRERDA